MTGAVALAIVLVIVVAGMSLAMQSQHPLQGQRPGSGGPRPRPVRPPVNPRRAKDRRVAPPAAPPEPPSPGPAVKPELLRSGVSVAARVISVVDERTIGPVTRSRLTLKIEPESGPPFEVTTRVAFPTPEARARTKVGGTIPVRYDKDDRTRVVVDLPPEGEPG